jgi:hypothetical protein
MCSKFENYTGFIVNSNIFESVQNLLVVDTNNYLDLYRATQLLVSAVLGQPIPIMIFWYRLTTADTKKTLFFISFKWYWLVDTKDGLRADTKDVLYSSVIPLKQVRAFI